MALDLFYRSSDLRARLLPVWRRNPVPILRHAVLLLRMLRPRTAAMAVQRLSMAKKMPRLASQAAA